MKRAALLASILILVSALPPMAAPLGTAEAQGSPNATVLSFEANRGQADLTFAYLARAAGYLVGIAADHARFLGDDGADVTMRLVGSTAARLDPEGLRATRSHYYIGNDPSAWATDVEHYDRIIASDPVPGISIVYRAGPSRTLEYDLVLMPGAQASRAVLAFNGATALRLDQGSLVIETLGAPFIQPPPIAYQTGIDGRRAPVEATFVLMSDLQVGFQLGAYDRSLPLVIDPAVTYASYHGGTAFDTGSTILLDDDDAPIFGGYTRSADFPRLGGPQAQHAGNSDATIIRMTPDGSSIVFAAYIGGLSIDSVNDLALAADGTILAAGHTGSPNFPSTSGAFDPLPLGLGEGFILRLSSDGSQLLQSTFLGGIDQDGVTTIALAPDGDIVAGGWTASPDFPTKDAIQFIPGGNRDAFALRFDPSLSSLRWSSLLGGNGTDELHGLEFTSDGSIAIAGIAGWNFPLVAPDIDGPQGDGRDIFIARIGPDGRSLLFSTYLGSRSSDSVGGLVVTLDDRIVVGGTVSSYGMPALSSFRGYSFGTDGFVASYALDGTRLTTSFLGGTGNDGVRGVALDATGHPVLVGYAAPGFNPRVRDMQPTWISTQAAFIARLSVNLTAVASVSLYDGPGTDTAQAAAVDSTNGVVVVGETSSATLPGAGAPQDKLGGMTDAFIARIAPLPELPPVISGPAPLQASEGTTLTFRVWGSDPDGDALTFRAEGMPTGATFTPETQTLRWDVGYTQVGNYVLAFAVTDGKHEARTTVQVEILARNARPILSPIPDIFALEGTPYELQIDASDADEDKLSFMATSLPEGAMLDASTGLITWTPSFQSAGNYPDVTFRVTDGILSAAATVRVTVIEADRPPIIDPIPPVLAAEGKRVEFVVRAVDPDGENVAMRAITLPAGATFSASGLFRWIPSFAQEGDHLATFAVRGRVAESVVTVQIHVEPTNRPPAIQTIPEMMGKARREISFVVVAIDPDGTTGSVRAERLPDGATFDPVTRRFSWRPTDEQIGMHIIDLIASDGALETQRPASIRVSRNLPPILAHTLPARIEAGEILRYSAIGTIDPDGGGSLRYEWDFDPATPSLDGTSAIGTRRFLTAGTYPVTLRAIDSDGVAATRQLQILVDDVVTASATIVGMDPDQVSISGNAKVRVQVKDDQGIGVPGALVFATVAHDLLNIEATTTQGVTGANGAVEIELPRDLSGYNVPGRHTVSVHVVASSRAEAPIADPEVASAVTGYNVA